MDSYKQFLACGSPWRLPSSIVLPPPRVSRSSKFSRFLSGRGDPTRVSAFPSNTQSDSGAISTSRRLTCAGVRLVVGRLGNIPPDHARVE